MSWAAHNPEKYDEIVRKGIVTYLDRLLDKEGFSVPGEWLQGYEALVETLQQTGSSCYQTLLSAAHKEIIEAEEDYFSHLHGE